MSDTSSQPYALARTATTWVVLVALASFTELTFGQTSDSSSSADPSASNWALGLGVTSRQLPYVGVDRDNKVVPIISYQNRWVRIAGATAELRLLAFTLPPSQDLSLGLKAKYEDVGYEAGDSPFLAGMDKRKSGFWGGPSVEWKSPIAKLSAEWVADLSGYSKGQKLQLQIDHQFRWGSFGLTPRVQAQWLDKKYVDYYFGVRANEARLGRAMYTGTAATAIEAGLRADYMLNRHNVLFMDLGVTTLSEQIKNSPIVDRSSVSRVTLGYIYRF